MTFKQFIIIPLYIAVLATILMVLSVYKDLVLPHMYAWVTFQAWAMYFLAGCTYKGGVKVLLGYLGGAIASVAIFELMGLLAACGLGGNAALWLAVFIIVIGVISAERIPWFDFVPAWFIGAGVFFGIMELKFGLKLTWANYATTGTHVMVSCAVGMIFGVVTVAIRARYEALLKSKQPAATEDTPEEEE